MPLQKIFKGTNYKIGIWEFNEHEFNLNHCKIIHPNYHKRSEYDFVDNSYPNIYDALYKIDKLHFY